MAGVLGTSALGLIGGIAIAVLVVMTVRQVILLPPGAHPHPIGQPTALDPGTYTAGKLKAPDSLNGVKLSPPTSQTEVKSLRDLRDKFSQSAGGSPAIAADYGQLLDLMELTAAQGYVDPDTYFGGSQVKYTTYGIVKCGSNGLAACIASDRSQSLSVVISGFSDSSGTGANLARAVQEAWKDFGGT